VCPTVGFATKPELALAQIRAACAAGIPRGIVLMDAGYGAETRLRTEITALGLRYIAGVQPHTTVWPRGRGPLPPKVWSGRGRPASRTRRDGEHQPFQVKALARGLPEAAWKTITWREGSTAWLTSPYARLRVRAAHRDDGLKEPRAEEWLIEWPAEEAEPTKYWLATLPEDSPFAELVGLAKLRWRIERDYQELKQELGLGGLNGTNASRLILARVMAVQYAIRVSIIFPSRRNPASANRRASRVTRATSSGSVAM
jgi:SRSO17 transposase